MGDAGIRTESRAAAFFDLDGTLTTGHMWASLQTWNRQRARRRWREWWFVLAHLPLVVVRKTGRISDEDFGRRWMGDMAGLLRGISEDDLRGVVRHTWEAAYAPCLIPATVRELRRHQRDGLMTAVVSGTYRLFLEPFRERLGVDHVIGTELEIADGVLTGRLAGGVVTGREKVRRVHELLQTNGVPVDLGASYAYADSERDLDLLRLVGNPVAVRPTPGLERIAREAGWPVLRDQG